MSHYRPEEVRPLSVLKDAFGDEVFLEGEDAEPYRILAEFELRGKSYAVLQQDRMKRDEELALFEIVQDEQGEWQLATIEDDDEWEDVLELYDEMTVKFDD